MSAANNGGSAFPIADAQMVHAVAAAAVVGISDPAERDKVYIEARAKAATGTTLRDYFATAALQGFIACHTGSDVCTPDPKHSAGRAYEYADAMLLERAK